MPRAAASERGFTLLEILIVMVLIAIVTAAAINIINFTIRDADAETEAKRFAALASLAAEQALLTGREYGVRLDEDTMRFFVFEDENGQWLPLDEDNTFRPRPLPAALDFDLVLEGQEVVLGGTADEEEQDQAVGGEDDSDTQLEQPQLMFLSSGEITPFTLTVSETDGEETWVVEGDLLGRMEVSEATR